MIYKRVNGLHFKIEGVVSVMFGNFLSTTLYRKLNNNNKHMFFILLQCILRFS